MKKKKKRPKKRKKPTHVRLYCSDCGESEKIIINNEYQAARPRCSGCGGALNRKHEL